MEFPKLPPEKNRRRKLLPQDIEQLRWLVKEGVPRKEAARQFGVSLATVDFWCWSEEQRKRHYERNKNRARERGYPYDPVKEKKRQKEYRAYKKMVHGAEVMKQFKYENNKQRYPQKNAGVRQRRLERAVKLLEQHGRAWMEERYQHIPEFLKRVYQYRASRS